MKDIKQFIVSLILAILLATVSIGSGFVLYRCVVANTIRVINKVEIPLLENKPSYKYLKSVTVRIMQTADEGRFIGTGTIIKITDDYTYILTNKHVAPMENRDGIYVVDEYSNKIKAEVCDNSYTVDLSLIRVKGLIENKQSVTSISTVKQSNKISSVGMYLGYDYIYTEGTVAGFDNNDNYIMNLPGSGGCSGSGVFNKKGDLVAVVFAVSYIHYPYQTETAKMICVGTWQVKQFLYLNGINL